jgi:signal transduction histidine kinase
VFVDSDQIIQVFLNLLINASKVMDEGGIILIRTALEATRECNMTGMIRVDVTDNGPGISQELQDKIFDPFFTTDKKSGSGLGLHVCQKILKEHNGSISVTSIPGEGATFTVLIPVAGNEESRTDE